MPGSTCFWHAQKIRIGKSKPESKESAHGVALGFTQAPKTEALSIKKLVDEVRVTELERAVLSAAWSSQ